MVTRAKLIEKYALKLYDKLSIKLRDLGYDDIEIYQIVKFYGPDFGYIDSDDYCVYRGGLVTFNDLAEYLLKNPFYGLLLTRDDEYATKSRERQENVIIDLLIDHYTFKGAFSRGTMKHRETQGDTGGELRKMTNELDDLIIDMQAMQESRKKAFETFRANVREWQTRSHVDSEHARISNLEWVIDKLVDDNLALDCQITEHIQEFICLSRQITKRTDKLEERIAKLEESV